MLTLKQTALDRLVDAWNSFVSEDYEITDIGMVSDLREEIEKFDLVITNGTLNSNTLEIPSSMTKSGLPELLFFSKKDFEVENG